MKTQMNNRLPISIIIPTKNEELLLPRLLQSISCQEFQPTEIIVADNNSTDKTVEIAKRFSAIITKGGMPAKGRNNGAKIATQPILFFIDADVILPDKQLLKRAYTQFTEEELDVASSTVSYDEESLKTLPARVMNALTKLGNSLSRLNTCVNLQCGAIMIIKRDVFDKYGGFPEEILHAEDSVFIRMLRKCGYKYKVLDLQAITSGRRHETPKSSVKVFLAGVIGILAVILGVKYRKKIYAWAAKVYGKLGGKTVK
ncbi:glycosyltransferase [Candidatus Dojkabacteria bacterium]|nr:glycosyltransferase [Candidatus Dojkabacteria bacterium]